MPPPPPCHHLEYDDVRTVEADLLDIKVLCLAVEDRNDAAMSDWRLRHRHTNTAGFLRLKSIGEFGFLKYATINLSLRQPANRQFQTSVPSTLDNICAESYHFSAPP